MTIKIPPHVIAMMKQAEPHRSGIEAQPALIDPLRLRQVMHAESGIDFLVAHRYWTGWLMDSRLARATPDGDRGDTRVIASCGPMSDDPDDDTLWIHASISHPDRLPTYPELQALGHAAFTGWSYQVFAPPSDHVDIHPWALHLWGRLDGTAAMPNFGDLGTI